MTIPTSSAPHRLTLAGLAAALVAALPWCMSQAQTNRLASVLTLFCSVLTAVVGAIQLYRATPPGMPLDIEAIGRDLAPIEPIAAQVLDAAAPAPDPNATAVTSSLRIAPEQIEQLAAQLEAALQRRRAAQLQAVIAAAQVSSRQGGAQEPVTPPVTTADVAGGVK